MAYSVLADSELRQEYDRQRLFYLQQAFHTSPAQAAGVGVRRKSTRHSTILFVFLAGVGILLGVVLSLASPFRILSPSFPSQPVFDIPDASPVYLWRPYEKQNCTDPNIQIHVPRDGQVMGWQEFTPHFTATGMSFVNYKLMLGTFRSDNQIRWEWIVGDQQSFQRTTLFGEGSWKPSYVLDKGRYVLRLIVQLQNQELRMCDSTFTVSY